MRLSLWFDTLHSAYDNSSSGEDYKIENTPEALSTDHFHRPTHAGIHARI